MPVDRPSLPPDAHPRAPGDLMRIQNAERSGSPFLTARDAGGALRVFTLEAVTGGATIGRDHGCDIVIDWDGSVSRTHVELQRVGTVWAIVDDGLSRNGTFVNGRRVGSRQRLEDGDTVQLGDVVLRFREPAVAPEQRTMTRRPGSTPELTPAQRRMLVELVRPMPLRGTPASNQEIAEALVISLDTVKAGLRTLFARFDLGDLAQNQKRAALAQRVLEDGVVTHAELSAP